MLNKYNFDTLNFIKLYKGIFVKQNILYLLIVTLLILSGCASHNPHIYDGPKLEKKELSTIRTDSKDISIEWINNHKIVSYQQLWNNQFSSTLYLKPDRYNI